MTPEALQAVRLAQQELLKQALAWSKGDLGNETAQRKVFEAAEHLSLTKAGAVEEARRGPLPEYGPPTRLPYPARLKGTPIVEAKMTDLTWVLRSARAALGNPVKARWRERNVLLVDAIEAELTRRRVPIPD